jgi:hypothetical protein
VRWLLPLLLASLLTLVVALSPDAGAERSHDEPAFRPLQGPRVSCARPLTLHLRRFEDGSAQLRCGGRILVRVTVPG